MNLIRLVWAALLLQCLAACGTWPVARESPAHFAQQVDAELHAQMQRGRIPGASVAVLKNGALVYAKSFGMANLELGAAVTNDSLFELASVTKQFTAAAILLLAHEGKLTLDDPIDKFIDETPPHWAGITVRHLLSHSAGLEHRFEKTVDDTLLMDYSTTSLLRSAKATPRFAPPGTRFRYSDQGYFLLGLVIERVQNLSYGAFLAQRFFTPLGMKDTTLQNQARVLPNRVAGYTVKDNALENIRRAWQFGLTSHFGVLSSLNDMSKWEQSLWSGQVLPAAVRAQLWMPLYTFRRNEAQGYLLAYGPGWWVIHENGHQMMEHSGITGTHYFRDAPSGLAVIVLTNRDQGSGQGTAEIARAVARVFDPTTPLAPK